MNDMMNKGEMKHSKYHWKCCWKPLIGVLLWLLAAASLVLAWVARDGVFLGYSGLGWYWNALVLGVLAIPLKGRGHHCHCGGHGDETCAYCGGSHGDCAGCDAGTCDTHKKMM